MGNRLEMRSISKAFPGVQALYDASLQVRPGEVHVLLGENGAGKSTLMKILAGVYQKDSGEVLIDGRPVEIGDTRSAAEHRIHMIHQELNLVPHLSVAENIFLGREPIKGWPGRIDWVKLKRDASSLLRELNLDIDPSTIVQTLSVAQQQMVEIARALSTSAEIIIMDEPTAAITEQETAELFRQIDKLKRKGVTIIYISHRLPEVKRIGDRVTIMRDGRVVNTADVDSLEISDMIRMMVGREITTLFPKVVIPHGDVALRVEHLSRRGVLHDISFEVRKGEVLGFAGLMGSGRTELMRAIFGADPGVTGRILVNGREVRIDSPVTAVRNGIAFLTEDRKNLGLLLNMPVDVNVTLATLEEFVRRGVVDHLSEETRTSQFVSDLRIKTPGVNTIVQYLSGGNQQKVVLARWLCRNADIIILDEPTRGIDVGAKKEIHELINGLTQQGKAVLLVSSDLPEVLGMSDRIAVMCEGHLTGILDREEATQEKVMGLATLGMKASA